MYLLSSSNNATLEKKIKSIVLIHESRKTYFAKYLLAYLDHYIVSSYLFLQFYVTGITKDMFQIFYGISQPMMLIFCFACN